MTFKLCHRFYLLLILYYIQVVRRDQGASFRLIWRSLMERTEIAFPVDYEGNTVLHVAALNGASRALDIMLSACVCKTGLSTTVLNSHLKSPLAKAIILDAARSILLFGGQPVAPLTSAADPDSSKSIFASPLLHAFKTVLHGHSLRFLVMDRFRGGQENDTDPRLRQKQTAQLCQLIVDSGYPLGTEKWLDYDFADVLLGKEGPVEFRSVNLSDVPDDMIDAARLLFESLKRQRRNPLPLKSLTRFAIRHSVMKNPCLRCRLDASGKTSLEGLMESLPLPPKLRNFVTHLDD